MTLPNNVLVRGGDVIHENMVALFWTPFKKRVPSVLLSLLPTHEDALASRSGMTGERSRETAAQAADTFAESRRRLVRYAETVRRRRRSG